MMGEITGKTPQNDKIVIQMSFSEKERGEKGKKHGNNHCRCQILKWMCVREEEQRQKVTTGLVCKCSNTRIGQPDSRKIREHDPKSQRTETDRNKRMVVEVQEQVNLNWGIRDVI